MVPYRHTQVATVLLVVFAFAALSMGSMFFVFGEPLFALAPAAVMGFVALLFHSLTVAVDDERVSVRMGWGPFRRSVPLARVRSVAVATSPWWYGWGIKAIPNGWMWNVSGFGAVDLVLDSGRVFRIGTDDPDGLAAAIASRLRPS